MKILSYLVISYLVILSLALLSGNIIINNVYAQKDSIDNIHVITINPITNLTEDEEMEMMIMQKILPPTYEYPDFDTNYLCTSKNSLVKWVNYDSNSHNLIIKSNLTNNIISTEAIQENGNYTYLFANIGNYNVTDDKDNRMYLTIDVVENEELCNRHSSVENESTSSIIIHK
ncbi:MAG: cupredoxin domain-containing protein [Nitrososphaeraceae archaeon]